jgi:multidrug resistance efflux pump
VQGKRIDMEIKLFLMRFEPRWGLVCCLILTAALITVIFYFHPTAKNVTSFFRAVPIVSETNGRVAEFLST